MSATDAATSPGAERVFSPLTAVWMVLVGIFAFSALMVLLAYAPQLETGDNGEAHALSKSAVGFAGIVEVLRLEHAAVTVNRGPITAEGRSALLILTADADTTLKQVEDVRKDLPTLVILPKWETFPDFRHRGWVTKIRARPPGEAASESLVAKLQLKTSAGVTRPSLHHTDQVGGQGSQSGPIDSLQTISAPGWTTVLADERGAPVLVASAHEPLWILSDPDFLNNQGLKDPDGFAEALALLQTIHRDDGVYIFDVQLNGLGATRSPLRLLFDPPFLAVTLCLAVAAGLAGYQAFFRFGPIRRGGRLIPLGKTVLVDNTAALIRLAGREHRMASRYADLTATLAARAVGAPRQLGGHPLEMFLDRLSARRGLPESFSDLALQARVAQSADRAAAAARRLFHWRMAMTGDDGGAAHRADASTRLDRT